ALSIIAEEVQGFQKWLSSLDLNPAIVELLEKGQEIANQELNKTLKKINARLSPDEIQALQTMVSSLNRKLYHHPITYFKTKAKDQDAAHYCTSLLREIFHLDKT
ncbi:MAG: glutamyl-tRNA reductase, partial [Thermodesulfobacteriota bacterium]